MKAANFETHNLASESPEGPWSIPPMMHVWTHSYNSDMALVVEMSSVIGGCSFFTKRGSWGDIEPN